MLRFPGFDRTLPTTGGVASYLKPNGATAVLPARSTQVPDTAAPELSGPA